MMAFSMAIYFGGWTMERDQAVDKIYKQCFNASPRTCTIGTIMQHMREVPDHLLQRHHH